MFHYLYVGHFDKDEDGFGRPVRDSNGLGRLVVVRPLETSVVEAILRQVSDDEVTPRSIPESWELWMERDHVVCNHYTPSRSALQFVLRLAQATQCDLLDSNLYHPVSVAQLEQHLRQPGRWID
jgi:hypothetical protein